MERLLRSPLRPMPPIRPRDSPGDAHGRRARTAMVRIGGPYLAHLPGAPPSLQHRLWQCNWGWGGYLEVLWDGQQSGARPNAMRSNAGHSYGIGNIVAGAVTYALQL